MNTLKKQEKPVGNSCEQLPFIACTQCHQENSEILQIFSLLNASAWKQEQTCTYLQKLHIFEGKKTPQQFYLALPRYFLCLGYLFEVFKSCLKTHFFNKYLSLSSEFFCSLFSPYALWLPWCSLFVGTSFFFVVDLSVHL